MKIAEFIEKYPLGTLQNKIKAYQSEFQIKVRDINHTHIQRYEPDQDKVDDLITYFCDLQQDMTEVIFDAFDDIEVADLSYQRYLNVLKNMTSQSGNTRIQDGYHTYQSASSALFHHIFDLESYIESILKPQKTIADKKDNKLINELRTLHEKLYTGFFDLHNKSARIGNEVIDRGLEYADATALTESRKTSTEVHLKIYQILDLLNQTPNQTLSEDEYNYIRSHIYANSTPDQKNGNERIIAIARAMITIAPGFDEMAIQIDQALKNFADRSLTQFMSCIKNRIQKISDDLTLDLLSVTKKSLLINMYLNIFTEVIPNLPLIASQGIIRYQRKDYNTLAIFASSNIDANCPNELRAIHDEYATGLLQLKRSTELFLMSLVKELNERIIRYEHEPTQTLADEIIERITAHKQCLNNYRVLFPKASIEGLSNFEYDGTLINDSKALLIALINAFTSKLLHYLSSYRMFDDLREMTRHIHELSHFKKAHDKFYYDQDVSSMFTLKENDIREAALKINQHAIHQIQLVMPYLFDITMKNILFLDSTLNHLLHESLNITLFDKVTLLRKMITLLSRNPHYKTSYVVFNDVSTLIDITLPNNPHADEIRALLQHPDFLNDTHVSQGSSDYETFVESLSSQFNIDNDKLHNRSIEVFIRFLKEQPTDMSVPQYESLISHLLNALPHIEKEKINTVLSEFIRAYLTVIDTRDLYTHRSHLISCYDAIDKFLAFNKALTYDILSESTSFIRHYSIHSIMPLLKHESIPAGFADKVTVIHKGWVDHILQKVSMPTHVDAFTNDLFILMHNTSIPLLEHPLSQHDATFTEHKKNHMAIFVKYIDLYINRFNHALDFNDHIAQYFDHLASFGLKLTPDQALLILNAINNLSQVPFKRLQKSTMRFLILLPPIENNDSLKAAVTQLLQKSVEYRAHVLSDAMLDIDDIYENLPDRVITTYQPDIEGRLSESAKAIVLHFNQKIRDNRVYRQPSQDVVRLNKQMIKLDIVTTMINGLHIQGNNQLEAQAMHDIEMLENPIRSFFNMQRNQASSLCTPLLTFTRESPTPDTLNKLKAELLMQYDRLVFIMTMRFIDMLEISALSPDEQIAQLQSVKSFLVKRDQTMCKSNEKAAELLSEGLAQAQQYSTLFADSPSEHFLKHITTHCLLIKDDYRQPITLITDKLAALASKQRQQNTVVI